MSLTVPEVSLTVIEACEQLRVSRSTVLRALGDGVLKGVKKHSCGSTCSAPETCKQGHWEITDESVKAFGSAAG